MRRRRAPLNKVSADLVTYLVERRGLSQNEIADMIEADKSFVSRVRKAEREFSPGQIDRIAQRLGVPMGALLLDALRPATPATGKKKKIMDLCEQLLHQADDIVTAMRAKKAS